MFKTVIDDELSIALVEERFASHYAEISQSQKVPSSVKHQTMLSTNLRVNGCKKMSKPFLSELTISFLEDAP